MESNEQRAAHQLTDRESAQAQNAVLAKIFKSFSLDERDMDLSPKNAAKLKQKIEDFIQKDAKTFYMTEGWSERRNKAMRYSRIKANKDTVACELDKAAFDILSDYARSFTLTYAQKNAYECRPETISPEFQNDTAGYALTRCYQNHLTRNAQLRFQALGLTERSALSLNGTLIGGIVEMYGKVTGNYAGISPEVNTIVSDTHAHDISNGISQYWRTALRTMKEAQACVPVKPRTIR